MAKSVKGNAKPDSISIKRRANVCYYRLALSVKSQVCNNNIINNERNCSFNWPTSSLKEAQRTVIWCCPTKTKHNILFGWEKPYRLAGRSKNSSCYNYMAPPSWCNPPNAFNIVCIGERGTYEVIRLKNHIDVYSAWPMSRPLRLSHFFTTDNPQRVIFSPPQVRKRQGMQLSSPPPSPQRAGYAAFALGNGPWNLHV